MIFFILFLCFLHIARLNRILLFAWVKSAFDSKLINISITHTDSLKMKFCAIHIWRDSGQHKQYLIIVCWGDMMIPFLNVSVVYITSIRLLWITCMGFVYDSNMFWYSPNNVRCSMLVLDMHAQIHIHFLFAFGVVHFCTVDVPEFV